MTQVLEKLLKNSENWKSLRRSPKSEVRVPAGEPVRIPTDADTIRMKSRNPKTNWLPWAAGLVLLGAGATVAWQAGWLPKGQESKAQAPAGNPSAPAVEPVPARPAPEQVNLAQWVFDHGGFVNVQTSASSEKQMGGAADIYSASALPVEPFTIWRVCHSTMPISDEVVLEELISHIRTAGTVANLNLRGLAVPSDALRHLATIETLTNLDLMASPAVTRDAIPHLGACKRLALLRIGGSQLPVDGVIAEELRTLLPDCIIKDAD